MDILAISSSMNLGDGWLLFLDEETVSEATFSGVDNGQIEEIIRDFVEQEEFKGTLGEIKGLHLVGEAGPRKLILAGLGTRADLTLEKLRQVTAKALKEGERLKAGELTILPVRSQEIPITHGVRAVVEAAILTSYRFDKYLVEKKELHLKKLKIAYEPSNEAEVLRGVRDGKILGEATALARDLVNEPANVMTPARLAEEARQVGKQSGFVVEVLEEPQIEALGMKAFLEVGRASQNRPRLIVMRYYGDEGDGEKVLGLVGKGLTYDSGGLSIKSKDSMPTMKYDMAGAAAVIGAMSAIAKLNLKINVVAVVAACENLVSGTGYRPGDVVETMAGKSVFVGSTDAEGRLTLADAVHYIVEKEKVSSVVDIATLTGAAIVALGHTTTGVITNDPVLFQKLTKASELSGERVWQLPSFEEYKELNKSPIADLKNTAGRGAGTITAGLFIGEFVQNKPWLHLDIAGTAFTDKDRDYEVEGGTGVGVRLLFHFAEQFI